MQLGSTFNNNEITKKSSTAGHTPSLFCFLTGSKGGKQAANAGYLLCTHLIDTESRLPWGTVYRWCKDQNEL